jgi:hypothetical protein
MLRPLMKMKERFDCIKEQDGITQSTLNTGLITKAR